MIKVWYLLYPTCNKVEGLYWFRFVCLTTHGQNLMSGSRCYLLFVWGSFLLLWTCPSVCPSESCQLLIFHNTSWIHFIFLAATKQLYDWFSPSVRLPVTPFSPCSHHRIIMKFSGVITMVRSDVHAKGQGQRSRSQRSTPNLAVSGL